MTKHDVSQPCWDEWTSKKAVANGGVVIVDSRNQALLLLKEKDKEWVIPSGGIDNGEYPIEAAVRELYEETRIKLSVEDLIELGTVTAQHPKSEQNKTDVIVTFLAFSNAECIPNTGEGLTQSQRLSLHRTNDETVHMHPTTRRQLWMADDFIRKNGRRAK